MSTIAQDTPARESRFSGRNATVQLVSFRLAHEEYAVDINDVREIILMGRITRVPQTPSSVKGMINTRREAIPIVDVREGFGLPQHDVTDETRIIVVDAAGRTIGILVDAVGEVLRVSTEHITRSPRMELDREYVAGLVKFDNRLLTLLDVDRILADVEVAALDAMAAGA